MKNIMKALTIASGVLLSGCKDSTTVFERAEQYLQDKPQTVLNEVANTREITRYEYYHYINAQSKLDSVAYRDVFETTKAAKDSSKVAEFNKIAIQNRANSYEDLSNKLANQTTVKDYKKMQNESSSFLVHAFFRSEYLQHKTDSIAYRKFFEKHNLLDEKTLKMFNKVSKQIKP